VRSGIIMIYVYKCDGFRVVAYFFGSDGMEATNWNTNWWLDAPCALLWGFCVGVILAKALF